MRKKLLTAAVGSGLILSAMLGTSLSYLTAHDTVENVLDTCHVKAPVIEDFVVPDQIQPGDIIKKAPRMKNVGDTACYVRMRYVFSDSLAQEMCEDVQVHSEWNKKEDGFYYRNEPLQPGEETESLFDEIIIKENAESIPQFSVLVYGESVAAQGKSCEEAWKMLDS
ncbi:MAG: hypothetical protein ACI4EI_10520 [Muricoprocola sp.]